MTTAAREQLIEDVFITAQADLAEITEDLQLLADLEKRLDACGRVPYVSAAHQERSEQSRARLRVEVAAMRDRIGCR